MLIRVVVLRRNRMNKRRIALLAGLMTMVSFAMEEGNAEVTEGAKCFQYRR